MKRLTLCLILILVTACGSSGGGGGGSTTAVPATSPNADPAVVTPSPTPSPAPTPTPSPAPTPAPAPAPAPTPSPAPAPAPAPPVDLTCYSNNGIFCSGGNLDSSVSQLDLDAMFLGGNNQLQINSESVVNELNATASVICSQPNGAGCFHHSVCVTVSIHVAGTQLVYAEMKCGNAVTNNSLGDI